VSKILASRLNYNGPRQIYAPNPIVIANNANGEAHSLDTVIRIPVPDSRTRVKVTVMFVTAAGTAAPNIVNSQTIWVSATDEDTRGGGGGRTVPVTDIEGTSAAPTPFPVSSGLLGYSREFVTAADFIEVTLHMNTVAAVGAWVLQTQIQPDAVSFSWDEWDAIRREFVPQNLGQLGAL